MKRTLIKFCGMTRRQDIDAALALGVDAIGMIIAERSPRRVPLPQAERLVDGLPPLLGKILLCMDNSSAEIDAAIKVVQPHYLQFHGNEPAAACEAIGLPYLKAVPMGSIADAAALQAYADAHPNAAGLVLDSHALGAAGGSGKTFDWSRRITLNRPWLLGGGLNPHNVAAAIDALQPFAVDVSSGIEAGTPGVKDQQAMQAFVEAVHRSDLAQSR